MQLRAQGPLAYPPTFLAVNASTNHIYVAHPTNNLLSVIDGATNTVITTIPVGPAGAPLGIGPKDVAVNAVTNRVYATLDGDNSVSVFDGATNSLIGSVS